MMGWSLSRCGGKNNLQIWKLVSLPIFSSTHPPLLGQDKDNVDSIISSEQVGEDNNKGKERGLPMSESEEKRIDSSSVDMGGDAVEMIVDREKEPKNDDKDQGGDMDIEIDQSSKQATENAGKTGEWRATF